jgi:Flp pilus assembly protein TadD
MRHFIAVALLASLSACQHGQNNASVETNGPSLQAARDALSEGEAGTALAIAKGVLSSQPHNVAALAQAGDAQAALGDRIAADTSYHQALAISPRDVRARLGLGKLQLRDNLPAAEATFRAVLADEPRNPMVLNDVGYVLDLQERHAEAQAMYQTALAIDPNRISTRVNLALSLALSGQGAKAEGMLRDVAASSSSSPRVRNDYALAQVMAGHDKEAASTLGSDLTPAETDTALKGLEQFKPATATK